MALYWTAAKQPSFDYSVFVQVLDADGEQVYQRIRAWVSQSGVFSVDESPARPSLFHVITPDQAFEKLGYRQLDIYVPIK